MFQQLKEQCNLPKHKISKRIFFAAKIIFCAFIASGIVALVLYVINHQANIAIAICSILFACTAIVCFIGACRWWYERYGKKTKEPDEQV